MRKQKKRILFVGAHPDDIEFSCGGFTSRYRNEHDIFWMVVTDGGDRCRISECKRSAELLGVKSIVFEMFDDGYVSANRDTIGTIQKEIDSISPDIVITHFPKDSHQDHRAVANIVKAAVRRRISLAYFDSYSAIDFSPNVYVDITNDVDAKKSAIRCHESQISKYSSRGIDFTSYAIAKNVGHGFECGTPFAEAFCMDGVIIRE